MRKCLLLPHQRISMGIAIAAMRGVEQMKVQVKLQRKKPIITIARIFSLAGTGMYAIVRVQRLWRSSSLNFVHLKLDTVLHG